MPQTPPIEGSRGKDFKIGKPERHGERHHILCNKRGMERGIILYATNIELFEYAF